MRPTDFHPGAFVWASPRGGYYELRVVDPQEGVTPVMGWGSSPEEAIADAFHRAGRKPPEATLFD